MTLTRLPDRTWLAEDGPLYGTGRTRRAARRALRRRRRMRRAER